MEEAGNRAKPDEVWWRLVAEPSLMQLVEAGSRAELNAVGGG